MAIFDKGDLIRLTATFTDDTNQPIDPTIVRVETKNPNGVIVTLEYGTDIDLQRDAEGRYHTDINVDTAGPWYYRWESTGSGQAAEEAAFDVTTYFP